MGSGGRAGLAGGGLGTGKDGAEFGDALIEPGEKIGFAAVGGEVAAKPQDGDGGVDLVEGVEGAGVFEVVGRIDRTQGQDGLEVLFGSGEVLEFEVEAGEDEVDGVVVGGLFQGAVPVEDGAAVLVFPGGVASEGGVVFGLEAVEVGVVGSGFAGLAEQAGDGAEFTTVEVHVGEKEMLVGFGDAAFGDEAVEAAGGVGFVAGLEVEVEEVVEGGAVVGKVFEEVGEGGDGQFGAAMDLGDHGEGAAQGGITGGGGEAGLEDANGFVGPALVGEQAREPIGGFGVGGVGGETVPQAGRFRGGVGCGGRLRGRGGRPARTEGKEADDDEELKGGAMAHRGWCRAKVSGPGMDPGAHRGRGACASGRGPASRWRDFSTFRQ